MKRTCQQKDLVILADHWVKIKENETINKYFDFAIKLKKKMWNMKVTAIPIIVGTLGRVTKFDHITKCYIHKPESFQENET